MKTRTIICPECGKQFAGAAANTEWKCPSCGYRFSNIDDILDRAHKKDGLPEINDETENIQPKKEKKISTANPAIAFKLCVFFGIFGAHRFYTKKYISGVIYLLTFGVFTIGWIIDIIRMFLGKFKDASGAYVDQTDFAKYMHTAHRRNSISTKIVQAKSSQVSRTLTEAYRIAKEKRFEK